MASIRSVPAATGLDPAVHGARAAAAAAIVRDIARGGLAGLLTGAVVGGLGGRIVMRVAALLSPDAIGRLTENGNRIGTISIEGTLAVLMFGGVLSGIVVAIVWVVASPWLPGAGRLRWAIAAVLAAALGASFLTNSHNPDFATLAADPLVVALLIGLVALMGATVAVLDGALDGRLPASGGSVRPALVVYLALAVIGVGFIPFALGFFTSQTGCGCVEPPVISGIALVAVGVVTASSWLIRVASAAAGPASGPPRALRIAGGLALLVAGAAGAVKLVAEVSRILAAA